MKIEKFSIKYYNDIVHLWKKAGISVGSSDSKKEIERMWYLVDTKDKYLGRIASRIANILRGKHKVTFTPHLDSGDFVVVINASKINFSGKKMEQKTYRRHTGYPGGLKEKNLKDLFEQKPEEVLKRAVLGMIPNNKLKKEIRKRLKIYKNDKHKHGAQKLVKLK